MNKVLIVTYYWPPGSGAGVQRWLKFAKYLPGFGWEPVILTVDPRYAAYPATDETLSEEISPGLKIYRTKATDWFRLYKKDKTRIPSAGFAVNESKGLAGKITRFIRGNFFIPDPRKGWNKYAVKKASELILKENIRHIITTSPPHSTQLIGLTLKKRHPDIMWITDLRDPWTDIYYYESFFHTLPARRVDSEYERMVLKTADRIITVGKSLKDLFCGKIPGIEAKTSVITNGYDHGDFDGVTAAKPVRFTISYIGTLSGSYPLKGFTDAVEELAHEGKEIMVRFVGSFSSGQEQLIKTKIPAGLTEFIPYVTHSEAIRYMAESSVLLLIIPDHRSNRSIITGKLFEYLASARPVLCIGPVDGDAAQILGITGNGKCADYHDTRGIRSIIEEFMNPDQATGIIPPQAFSRENLTDKLAALLENRS